MRLFMDKILFLTLEWRVNNGYLGVPSILRVYGYVYYPEAEQMRLAKEQELQEWTHRGVDSPRRKILFPSNHKNYQIREWNDWTFKHSWHSLVYLLFLSPIRWLYIPDKMKRLRFSIHRGVLTPHGSKPRSFDRPNIIARVYNQFANNVMSDLEKKFQTYLWR